MRVRVAGALSAHRTSDDAHELRGIDPRHLQERLEVDACRLELGERLGHDRRDVQGEVGHGAVPVTVSTAHVDDVYGVDAGQTLTDAFERGPERLLEGVARSGAPGARVAYWNMMVERCSPGSMMDRLSRADEKAMDLFLRDKAFFYRAFILEQVVGIHEPALCAIES